MLRCKGKGNHMKAIFRIFAFSLITLLSGCVTMTWTYDNQNYPTSTAAIEAARQDIRRKVSAVPPLEQPFAESALIFTPSIPFSRQGVVLTGNATEEQARYIATVLYYGYYGMAEAIDQRRIFATTHIREFDQRAPLSNSDYQYIIWLRLDGPDSARWMIAPGDDIAAAAPLATSPISDPQDRMIRFVQNVEDHVRRNKD